MSIAIYMVKGERLKVKGLRLRNSELKGERIICRFIGLISLIGSIGLIRRGTRINVLGKGDVVG
jgi:hypothetical protein